MQKWSESGKIGPESGSTELTVAIGHNVGAVAGFAMRAADPLHFLSLPKKNET